MKEVKKQQNQGKGIAIAAMVLGICSVISSIFFFWIGFISLILGIIAIIFSIKGIKIEQGKGMAIAGLVTGIIGTVLGFIYSLIWLLILRNFATLGAG